jgi:hypothetical protein
MSTPPETLVPVAAEIKILSRRGLTLVQMYGKQGGCAKCLQMPQRSNVAAKFDAVNAELEALLVGCRGVGGVCVCVCWISKGRGECICLRSCSLSSADVRSHDMRACRLTLAMPRRLAWQRWQPQPLLLPAGPRA